MVRKLAAAGNSDRGRRMTALVGNKFIILAHLGLAWSCWNNVLNKRVKWTDAGNRQVHCRLFFPREKRGVKSEGLINSVTDKMRMDLASSTVRFEGNGLMIT